MNRKMIVTAFVAGALALSTLFGAMSFRTASAATPATDTTAASAQPAQGAGPHGDRGQSAADSTELAAALGITVEKLNAAYASANTEALKLAVEQGLITQAQADEITARSASKPMGGREFGKFAGTEIDYDALLAKALNISVEKLAAARLSVFTARIDAAVAAGTMTQAQADLEKGEYALRNSAEFKTSLQTAYETAVKAAVTKGTITQAQADAILAAQQTGGRGGFGLPGGEGGRGGHGGHGGRGERGGQAPADAAGAAAPATTTP